MEDFQEIVKKFLSRENTYSQLLDAVTDAEKRREQLRGENEKLAEELRNKAIELDGVCGKDEEGEVFKLKQQLAVMDKEEQSLLEKYQKCCIVYDQLRGWVLRTYKMLLSILEASDKHTPELAKLRALDIGNTEVLFVQMCEVLHSLTDTYGHIESTTISIKQLAVQDECYNDEEYIARNVRIRPTTKPALKRDDSVRSSSAIPALNSVPASAVTEAEQDQRIINSEFRDDRKNTRVLIKKTVRRSERG